jgi:two-component system chemotaxis response regulator CheB
MPFNAIESTEVDSVLPLEEIGPKLVALAATEAASSIAPISSGGRNMAASGQAYSCPECGGVLEEIQENRMVRFRCRVGHLYSPGSLLADQGESVEKALWAAIRIMEEQGEFADRLATSSRQKKRARLARRFAEKAEASRENANVLRDLLQKSAEEIFELPSERTGTE